MFFGKIFGEIFVFCTVATLEALRQLLPIITFLSRGFRIMCALLSRRSYSHLITALYPTCTWLQIGLEVQSAHEIEMQSAYDSATQHNRIVDVSSVDLSEICAGWMHVCKQKATMCRMSSVVQNSKEYLASCQNCHKYQHFNLIVTKSNTAPAGASDWIIISDYVYRRNPIFP